MQSGSSYLLGEASTEHDRLVRQSALFHPVTHRLFREAGIGSGQRVLDVGSGVGDVTLLAARLVGPSGAVVGVERDPKALAIAASRAADAGLANVSFIQAEIEGVSAEQLFDAVVGRFIVEYLPKAGEVVRSLAGLLRPGGVMAFQDASWGPWLRLSEGLPLLAKCVSLIVEAFARSGAHVDMELVFYRTFQEAGLPAPTMRVEIPIGDDPNIVRYAHDLFFTLLPRMDEYGLSLSELGDLETLKSRLEEERVTANSFGSSVGLVSAWSRKPG